MNHSIPFFLLLLFFVSCGMPESHSISTKEKAKIDALEQQLHCEIWRSFSHESFDDLPDLELTITGLPCPADSVGYMAEYIAGDYLPCVDYKGRYRNIIVNMESGNEGKVGVGGKQIFRFRLDE